MATKPIPVRIPAEILPRLDKTAERLGTTRSGLIAFCARTFVEDFERRGEAMMPPNWQVILDRLDGRTTEAHANRGRYPGLKPANLRFNEESARPEKPTAQVEKKTEEQIMKYARGRKGKSR